MSRVQISWTADAKLESLIKELNSWVWSPAYAHGHLINLKIKSRDITLRFMGEHELLPNIITYISTLPDAVYVCELTGDHPLRYSFVDINLKMRQVRLAHRTREIPFLLAICNKGSPGQLTSFDSMKLPDEQYNRIVETKILDVV